jgi:hypothetical protein
MEMLMMQPQYTIAAEGLHERIAEMTSTIERWVYDLQDWGETHDG